MKCAARLLWCVVALWLGGGPGAVRGTPLVQLQAPDSLVCGKPTSLVFRVSDPLNSTRRGDIVEIQFPLCAPVPKFQWSPPQNFDATAPGYVTVKGLATVQVRPPTVRASCRGREVPGDEKDAPSLFVTLERPLGSDVVVICYGDDHVAEGGRALTQPFPEESVTWRVYWSRTRENATSPSNREELTPLECRVLPRAAMSLHLSGDSESEVGASFQVRAASLDSLGFEARAPLEGIRLRAVHEAGDTLMLRQGEMSPARSGVLEFDLEFPRAGIWWVESESHAAWALPVVVREVARSGVARADRLAFGDLHWHSEWSDGSRHPREGFVYGRDVVGLDFVAQSDHDIHSIFPCLEESDWKECAQLQREFDVPDKFSALLAYEWTSGIGHAVVIHRPSDEPLDPSTSAVTSLPELVTAMDCPTPSALRDTLAASGALVIPAHPAGGGLVPPYRWDTDDPHRANLVEIFSMHGNGVSSMGSYAPVRKGESRDSNRARRFSAEEAFTRGFHLGLVASTDNHTATPGNPIRHSRPDIPASTGLAGVWVPRLTSQNVFQALAERRCYATTGPRIRLEWRKQGQSFEGLVAGAAALERVEIVGVSLGREVPLPTVAEMPCDGRLSRFTFTPSPKQSAEFSSFMLRVTQRDGEMAWAGPLQTLDSTSPPENAP